MNLPATTSKDLLPVPRAVIALRCGLALLASVAAPALVSLLPALVPSPRLVIITNGPPPSVVLADPARQPAAPAPRAAPESPPTPIQPAYVPAPRPMAQPVEIQAVPKAPPAPAAVPFTGRELHMVGVYEGDTGKSGPRHGPKVDVAVDRPGKAVDLLLCSYQPVRWMVSANPGTTVGNIYVDTWTHARSSELLVDGVATSARSAPAGVKCTYQPRGQEFRATIKSLPSAFGVDRLASFVGAYTAPEAGFVVHEVSTSPDMGQDRLFPVGIDGLPAMRFQASLGAGEAIYDLAGRRVGEATGGSAGLAVAVSSNATYRFTDQGLVASTPSGKKVWPVPLDLPEVSWPMGLAFDSKRNRLVLVTLGGEGFLYAFDLAKERWSLISSMNNVDLGSLIYDPNTDRLIGLTNMGGNELRSYAADGSPVGSVDLSRDALPGLSDLDNAGGGGMSNITLAAVKDGWAAIVTKPQYAPSGAAPSRIWAVNLTTGETRLTYAKD